MLKRLRNLLASPVDGASLAMFRIFFGSVMLLESLTLLWPAEGGSRLQRLFTGDEFGWHVPYHGFEWVRALPEPWMSMVCLILGGAGLALAVGLLARWAAVCVFLSWTYLFLIDAVQQNNHYYLMSLLAFLLIFMPSDRCYRVRAWWRASRGGKGGASASAALVSWVPFWTVFLLRGQLLIVYFFGGLVKLNADWLLRAEPMRIGLTNSSTVARWSAWLSPEQLDALSQFLSLPAVAFAFAYAGLVFDLSIGFLLLVRRTRALGMVLVVLFHGLNHFVLFEDIGWFPLLGVAATTIFLEPDWPRRLAAWLREPTVPKVDMDWLVAGAILIPVVGAALGFKGRKSEPATPRADAPRAARLVLPLVGLWLLVQVAVPLRHWLIPGDVNWTAEGDRFSWRMKAASRQPGPLRIRIVDHELFSASLTGQAPALSPAWQGPRTVYHDVDGRAVDWTTLPELVVLVQPLHGERVVYNPLSEARPSGATISDDAERARRLWQQLFGRQPHVTPTLSLADILKVTEQIVGRDPSAERARAAVEQGWQLAEHLEELPVSDEEYTRGMVSLRQLIGQLAASRQFGASIRAMLAICTPFALEGGKPVAGFLAIDDRAAFSTMPGATRVLNRDIAATAGGVAALEDVYVDFGRLSAAGWQSLPQVMLLSDPQHGLCALWNPHAELPTARCHVIAGRPYMLHQYVQYIADRWESQHGRRPQIFVSGLVSLNRRPMRPLVDPDVDLAAAELRLFSHNDWILPPEDDDGGGQGPDATGSVTRVPPFDPAR